MSDGLAGSGPSRRGVLVGGLATVAVAGCDGVRGAVARSLGAAWPVTVTVPDGLEIDSEHAFLNRVGLGPWPGDRARLAALGRAAFLEEQLHPEGIDDTACRALARRFESVEGPAAENLSTRHAPLAREHARHELLRATFSRRQLLESLVVMWGDHFNVALGKGDVVYYKAADTRRLRTHALGSFRDLLRASATSPAMLLYLDGADNKGGPGEVPNENHARELLELHALGVHGGYSQRDVMEAARAMSGWTLNGDDDWGRGTVAFRPGRHDDGSKTLLGRVLPEGQGEADLDAVIDTVVAHPGTSVFIASKLCRWFLGEDPPEDAIANVAQVFRTTDGDLRACVRATLEHPALLRAPGTRLKRPLRFVVSALRSLGALHHAGPDLLRALDRMGQSHGGHPTPDGYPWAATPWLGTLDLRWAFARALADGRAGASVPWDALRDRLGDDPTALWAHLVGRSPTEHERVALLEAWSDAPDPWRATATLTLASPAFQGF